jgi:hypothetical protein
MLAIVPEKCRHRMALLSRLSEIKIARSARESKPKPLSGSNPKSEGLKQQETSAVASRA